MIVEASFAQLEDLVELFDQYRVFYNAESDKEAAHKFLTDRMRSQESIVFIFYKDNQAVGFTQLYPTYSSVRMEKNWILNDLYVQKAHRHQGIGEQLIQHVLDFAKKNQANYVQLETQVDNFTAQGLYRKMDFELQDVTDTTFLLFKRSL